MSYISKIDLSTAPQEVRAAVDNHLAQGYQLTNEKLTLLHSRSLRAVCWASGPLDICRESDSRFYYCVDYGVVYGQPLRLPLWLALKLRQTPGALRSWGAPLLEGRHKL